MRKSHLFRSGFWKRREEGGVAVEFAIILPVLTVLVFGIVDFGHGWYMRTVMENACREGARYGSRYQTDATGLRLLPNALNPTIENYVKNSDGCNLTNMLPADAVPAVTPSGAGYTETDVKKLPLENLTVTVTAKKTWFILNKLVPGITEDHADISVSATMKCE
jgi:Flp pilus assembly protein TadG